MGVMGFFARRAADAALPGSGVVIGLIERLRPAIPYIAGGLALLVVGVMLYRAPWAESRQKAADYARFQPKLEQALKRELAAAKSIKDLRGAIDRQNAASLDLHNREMAKLAQAQRDLAAARARDANRQVTINRLRESAATAHSGAPCAASEATKGVWQ